MDAVWKRRRGTEEDSSVAHPSGLCRSVEAVYRREFWTMIHGLAATGVTIFATAHYLDEAEQAGTLAALATPADFKAHFLRGRLFAVRSAEMLRALEALRQQPDTDVSLYGDTVHALLQHGDEASMTRALTDAGILDATIEPIAPSLEDVFISLIKKA